MIEIVKSNRAFEVWPSWNIVHEWENIISSTLKIPVFQRDLVIDVLKLIPVKKLRNKLCREYVFSKKLDRPAIVFHLEPLEKKFLVAAGDIPIVVDISKNLDTRKFEEVYEDCKLVYVTSKEVYNFLVDRIKINIKYVPLTLPDQYFLGSYNTRQNKSVIAEKDIDILQIGRPNNVLDRWTKIYLEKYPLRHYVYREVINNKIYIRSNKLGLIDKGKTRSDYFDLLKKSKVVLYSSPGMDDGYKRTGGFNALTPRLLESLSRFNYIIARYANNVDYQEVSDHIPNCQTYEMFEENMNRYLDQGDLSFLQWSGNFLSNYLTSSSAKYFENENE